MHGIAFPRVLQSKSCFRHSVAISNSFLAAEKRRSAALKCSEVSHQYQYLCFPTVILVSQQWHLNAPTRISQRKGVSVNSPRFSPKLHDGSAPGISSSLWYVPESSVSCRDVVQKPHAEQPEQSGREDMAPAGEPAPAKIIYLLKGTFSSHSYSISGTGSKNIKTGPRAHVLVDFDGLNWQ